MFFMLSKLLSFLLEPGNLSGFIGVAGLIALLLRFNRTGKVALCLSVLCFALFGWSPLPNFALGELEDRFPVVDIDGPITGVVVLGGSTNEHISGSRGVITTNDAGERLTAAANLALKFPAARIIVSGGSAHIEHDPNEESEAEEARSLLASIGIPSSRIELEDQSRNTFENAQHSLKLANPKPGDRWLLVTSASHMPRSVAVFRAVGFEIVPFPVDFRTLVRTSRWTPSSMSEGLAMADLAAHEWIGLAAYWLTGKTREFLPAPR